jgi:hypothetical protein
MVFEATFNNMSVISWGSVILVEETGVPRENHRPVASHWQALSHNVVSSTPRLCNINPKSSTKTTQNHILPIIIDKSRRQFKCSALIKV